MFPSPVYFKLCFFLFNKLAKLNYLLAVVLVVSRNTCKTHIKVVSFSSVLRGRAEFYLCVIEQKFT